MNEQEVKLVDVSGHVFRGKGKGKDIIFHSKTGLFNKDFSKFIINGDAYINYDNIELKSEEFKLHKKNVLTNKVNTFFISEKLQGNALKGIYFDLNKSFYSFKKVKGVLKKAKKTYFFKTEKFFLKKNEHLAVLLGNAEIKSKSFFISAKRINNFFDNDNKKVIKTSCHGDCVVKFLKNETNIICKSNTVFIFYNEEGKASEIKFSGQSHAEIFDKKSKSKIESEIIKISLDGESGEIKDIFTPKEALINQSGEKKFKLKGARTRTYFKEGKITKFNSMKKTFFNNADYRVSSRYMEYDVENNRIVLAVNVEIRSKKNVFYSNEFIIDTKSKTLISKSDTKTLFIPNKVKSNSIVKNDEIIINCKSMKADELKGEYIFDSATLSQENMNWYGKKITINKDNSISSEGLSHLFIENLDNKSLRIKGDNISYISNLNQLTAQGKAKFNIEEKEKESTSLLGNYISMLLNKQGVVKIIEVEEKENLLCVYTKGNVTGKAFSIRCNPLAHTVVLSGKAEVIDKSRGWNTKGRMLEIDTKKETITAISEEGKRTETIY